MQVAARPDAVWSVLSDVRRVVPCVPGAELISFEGDQLEGRMRVALGPIKTSFKGRAQVAFEPALQEGVVTGQGRDSRLGSSAQGQARWRVTAAEGNTSTIIVSLRWKLTGVLAQFNRGGLLRDVIRRLAADFAANLEATIAGQEAPATTARPINAFALMWQLFKARFLGRGE
ncbi:MAG: SRPBCC family protein [Methylobacteriaceae bacterium]|nr:SRPBCC family protein [Methylobacteriaceae bacterium]